MKEKVNRNLIIFIRQLSLIIDSDISVFEGLDLIKNKTDDSITKAIVDKTLEGLNMGMSLADAISESDDIPLMVKNMINIGEQSGDLPFALSEVSDSLEKDMETSQKVKQAITYPIILAILMFGVIILLVIKVLPMFNDILMSLGGNMPAVTRNILDFSLFLSRNGWIILGVIVALVVGFKLYFSSEKGRMKRDKLRLSLPVLGGINSSIIAVKFARNLSMLYKAGIPVSTAFEMICGIMDNSYIISRLKEAKEELDMGTTPDKVLEDLNIFPWVLTRLFSVAQTTGHMEEMLVKAADYMEEDANNKVAKLTSVIEPALIIILSIIIGIILVSVMLPVINIMNTIS